MKLLSTTRSKLRSADDLLKPGSGLLRRLSRQPLGVLPQTEMRNLFVADNPEYANPVQPIGWTPWWYVQDGSSLAPGSAASRRDLFVARAQHKNLRIDPFDLPLSSRTEKLDVDMKWAWIADKKLPFMRWREEGLNRRWLANTNRLTAWSPRAELTARHNRAGAKRGLLPRMTVRTTKIMNAFIKDSVVPGANGTPAVHHRRRNVRRFGIINKTL